MSAVRADFVVIGGGVIGLCVALELKRKYSDSSILVLEKEKRPGLHASGRNSGVLHAGFYYPPKSLKAKFTRDGNRFWTAYCIERKLPIRKCGKLVVARSESDLPSLDLLYSRGLENQIEVQKISLADAVKIEPRVKTFERALFSPSTSTIDPERVLAELQADAEREGIKIHFDCRFLRRQGNVLETTTGKVEFGYVVNCAGLQADQIAHSFGCGLTYGILPFKGLYLYSNEPPESYRTHIYPVPDLNYPFLGVHITVAVSGQAKIGPTAIPALWREQYGWGGLVAREILEVSLRQLRLFFASGSDFRRLVLSEVKKYSRRYLVEQAKALSHGVELKNYDHWGRPGIRAQLIDLKTDKMVMDFVFDSGERSFHVLNAVSPAFTCAVPFSRFVVEQISKVAR